MADTDGLAVFLAARWDDLEAAANALYFAARIPGKIPDFTACGGPAAEEFWRLHDPASVLAGIEAKRKILAICRQARKEYDAGEPGLALHAVLRELGYCVRALAEPFGSHPEFKAEWAQ